jgi:putative peptide zinc metalloprotease protein
MTKPLSSTDRPLALRLRPDLQAVAVEMSGTTTWVMKDPVTLEHFQFSDEEYALANLLRQPMSIGELQRAFARLFPPQTITPQGVWDFLSRLHSAGLLVGDAAGQGHELLARMRRERTQRWWLSWTQILAIRFRGIDPDRFLTALHNGCRWLFSPPPLLAAVMLVAFAGSLVISNWAAFHHRLPDLSALVDFRNLPWLLVAIGLVKVLHELGHALVCKHFGGEVRELGLMLLSFAPCLYCDVTDAWRLPSKWQRIAVSAAGMGVELVLASLATIVWWYAQPGALQLIALNIIIVCTVNTLLVNGNPLLRYDGYYILSDLVETPNLWQRSREALQKFIDRWLIGRPTTDDPLVPARRLPWLATYAVASKVYMVMVCVTIVWGLVQVLYPLHLETLAYAAGCLVLASAMVGPVTNAVRLVRNPSRRAELPKGRIAWVATLGLAALVAILAIPVNYYVPAPLVLMPADAARVYATVDGTLASALPAGQRVARGATIARLESGDVTLELARLDGEHRLQQMRVEHLERLRGVDPESNDQLPTARAARAESERRLADGRREAERLTLIAPVDGVVIPASRIDAEQATDGRLPTWSGSVLDQGNRGAQVKAGTLICLVGDPQRLTAVLLVDDADVKRLQPGQAVRMRIDQLPGQVVDGRIVEVARHESGGADSTAAGQSDLAELWQGVVPAGEAGALYQARVAFDLPSQPLVIGGRGEAKVAAERITLARRIWRYLAHTFRLPM